MPLTFAAMQPAHLPGAVRLSTDAGWPHREEDWRLVLDISRGFAALQEGKVVATALATPFGDAAMVNMVIVDASLRRMGIARAMMELVMAAANPASWHLVATDAGLPLYEAFGFRRTGEIAQHQGIVAAVRPSGEACWGTPADLEAIIGLDRAASGMDGAPIVQRAVKGCAHSCSTTFRWHCRACACPRFRQRQGCRPGGGVISRRGAVLDLVRHVRTCR